MEARDEPVKKKLEKKSFLVTAFKTFEGSTSKLDAAWSSNLANFGNPLIPLNENGSISDWNINTLD